MKKLKDSLTQTLGFSSEKIDELIEICEQYDKQIQTKKAFNVTEFKNLVRGTMNMSYSTAEQSIKAFMNDFFDCQKCLYLVYAFEYLNNGGKKATITSAYESLTQGTKEQQEMKDIIDELIEKSPKITNNSKMEMVKLIPIIKDIAIILVCVLILVASINYSKRKGWHIALPITDRYFYSVNVNADISGFVSGFDGEISNDEDCSSGWGCRKIPLEIRIVK